MNRAAEEPPQRSLGIASFPPPLHTNAYQRELYERLSGYGIVLVPHASLGTGWLWRHRRRDGSRTILHFHWPNLEYRVDPAGGREDLQGWALWRAGLRFGLRLVLARMLGYAVVWTVHQVTPHESCGPADMTASALLALASNAMIVHDDSTAADCRMRLPRSAHKLILIPHASYEGVYSRASAGADVRRSLGVAWASFVFLSFGLIRRYKNIDLLLDAFARTSSELPGVALVIAGEPHGPGEAQVIERAAASDFRIRPLLRFVPDDDVADLFSAADAFVYPRSDGGTAGSILLSLSLGTPVVAARVPAYEELIGEETAGWLFAPGDAVDLAQVLVRAADPAAATVRGLRAAKRLVGHEWPDVARRTAEVLRDL